MSASHRFDNALRYRDESDPRQVALTPAYVLEPVRRALGGIDLDPCTEPDNPVGATRFYALPQDGAALPWDAERIFVNPPYGRARERFVDRCVDAAAAGSRVVLLMPAHTDTRCFQKAAATAAEVLLVRGRLKFGVLRPNQRQVAASHPTALFAWNVTLEACRDIGVRLDLASPGEPSQRDEMRYETSPRPGCCPACGGPLPAAGTGRPARYCSPACRQRAYRRRQSVA